MKTHRLKTWPDAFSDVWIGRKRFEVRKADRAFAVGDMLLLVEYDPETGFTGRKVECYVTYIIDLTPFGCPGYVGMQIDVWLRVGKEQRSCHSSSAR